MTSEKRACMGAPTITHKEAGADFEECQHCGTRVRWDLVDHPFFGFAAHCDTKDKECCRND